MKENFKNKKGITLIALVITIIVLLILAIVTIRIVVNQNIINHANNAVTAYNEAQQNESEQLTWVEGLMQNKGGSSSSISNSNSETQGNQLNNKEIYQLTAQEKQEFYDKQGSTQPISRTNELVASNNEKTVMISTNDEENILSISITEGDNMFVYSSTKESGLSSDMLNKWLQLIFVDGESDPTILEYTGGALISTSEFTTVNSQTLLNRIVATFNS